MTALGANRAMRQRCRLERIHAYVEAHYADPGLAPRTAALALGMSVRSLHGAMAAGSESFGRVLTRRRLQACHALLIRAEHADSITGIALACGFSNLSTFYRAFRAIYGMPPAAAAELRPRHQVLPIDHPSVRRAIGNKTIEQGLA